MGARMLSAAPPLTDGVRFMDGSKGRWAGERFMEALKRGEKISPSHLRLLDTNTNGLLRRDEWLSFDRELLLEAQIRLRGVQDLINLGLVKKIPNGLAKTILEWQAVTDMDPATVSMSGVTRSENDRVEFEIEGLPLPITHKDFYLDLRLLLASRSEGYESLDTTHLRVAGRKCAEMTEDMLFNGGKTFAGRPIYGYTTHPLRHTSGYGTGGAWGAGGKTGEQMLVDLQTGLSILEADRQYGPYGVYVGADASVPLGSDFKAQSDKTIRQRLLETDNISFIRVADKLPDGEMVIVQLTSDVVVMVEGEPLQTVQWDVHGGFQINFKAFQIMVPLIRVDAEGRSGIVHFA